MRSAALREPAARALFLVTLALFGIRFSAMRVVGFGDSEALYASYALHPAPAYLDQPGLVGSLASFIGGGGAPTPERAHAFTIVLVTLLPWLLFAVARIAGASTRAAFVSALTFAAVPEIAIGLFALTPDLALAPLWLGALGAAIEAIKGRPGDVRASAAWLAAGLFAGACGAAKVSGLLLPLAFIATLAMKPLRPHARTPWPWIGLALGAIVICPIALYELKTGTPLLRHRLIDTQSDAGVSLRNIGALFGGQLAYVSPLLLVAALLAARDLVRRRFDDPIDTLLFFAWAVPSAVLVPLMSWSRVAEPHWLAPALLSLPIAAARAPFKAPRWLVPTGIAIGLVIIVFVHAWVLVPESFAFARPVDPKHDISSELFGWDEAERSIRELLATEPPGAEVVVVGPHWTVCAQIHARLGRGVHVGCMTPIRDDFADWYPRAQWEKAEKILYVTDLRFPGEPAQLFSGRMVTRTGRATLFRGGRLARKITFTLLEGAARVSL